ncbi:CDK-activating kinase assembly factor [Ramaria rubella]|nr:CDK-activating kinase assembly factor [Ramaria rubella]
MSKAGWLRGSTKRGGTSAVLGRSSATGTPQGHVQSTSTTVYGGGVKDASGKTAEFSSMDDQCPVCKSDRYLNPKLRLLVSSTCYHKMCESCIDRLFTLGPAPCPICAKILRKLAFTPQTFEDLTVEKEVAVRRRISKEFNKRHEDFADLRSYNDYLEMVEDITFNLINEVDVPETEARIASYRAENAALIQLNIQREKMDAQELQEEEERDRREREERMRELRREEEEERQEREKERKAIIDGLESGKEGSAARVIAKSRADALKRNAARAASSAAASSQSKLLRSRAAIASTIPDVPHEALTDDWYAYDDKYVVRTYYDDPQSESVRADREGVMRAGGYRVDEAWERAIRMAVAGLEIAPLQGMPDVIMAS